MVPSTAKSWSDVVKVIRAIPRPKPSKPPQEKK